MEKLVSDGGSTGTRGREERKGKGREDQVDEAWRLEEVEEATLLEVLVTSLSKARADAVASTKKVWSLSVFGCGSVLIGLW